MHLTIKRAYEPVEKQDGYRILVDRLWPRGLTKVKAGIDLWLKDIGPSTELRKWFGHDPEKWTEFKKRYRKELENKKEDLSVIKDHSENGDVTLIYAARDTEHNEARVILDLLQ